MAPDSRPALFDEATAGFRPHKDHPAAEDGGKLLVVVRRQGKVIETLRIGTKRVTFGRSRKNSIVLDDPIFPRMAGEIIPGPVPHYRKVAGQEGVGTLTPMVPGKEYRFPPYVIRLLNPGDTLHNRRTSGKRKLFLLSAAALITVLSAVFCSIAGQRTWAFPEATLHPHTAAAVDNSTDRPDREDGESASSPKPVEPLGQAREREAGEAVSNKRQMTVHGDDPAPRKKAVPRFEDFGNSQKGAPSTVDKKGIGEDEFCRVISAAEVLLARGQLDEAIRVVNPTVPFANDRQREKITETVEPILGERYRRAYILKDYDRSACIAMLREIARYQVEFLPSCRKAKDLLAALDPGQ